MPITKDNLRKAEQLRERFKALGDTENYGRLDSRLREYYDSTRKTDENGKLTAEPVTRLPARVEATPKKDPPVPIKNRNDSGFTYHYEPNVGEVQKLVRENPAIIHETGDDPDWVYGIDIPEGVEDVTDPTTGMKVGENHTRAQTHLDTLKSDGELYEHVADYMWNKRMEEARAKGENVIRYKDVPLDKPVDFLAGGAAYNINRRLAPFALEWANGMTLGTAGPAGDYLTKKIGEAASGMGYDIGPQPTAEDVRMRSPASAFAGGLFSGGFKGNPSNLIQEGLSKAAGYEGRGIIGKAVIAAGSGATTNVATGQVADTAQGLSEGKSLKDAVVDAGHNSLGNLYGGAALGGGFDLIGQGVGGLRNILSRGSQNMTLLKQAGGETRFGKGVKFPEKVNEYANRADQASASGEPGMNPGAFAAEDLEPKIRESLDAQDVAAKKRIEDQKGEYFSHADYRDIKEDGSPMVDTMLDMYQRGRFRGAHSGDTKNIDPGRAKAIAKELSIAGEPAVVSKEEAQEFARRKNGRIIDPEMSQELFGVHGDIGADQVIVVVPEPLTANLLTQAEDRIGEVLKYGNNGKPKDDPLYKALDLSLKRMRDKFPLWRDRDGKLVSPPPQPQAAPEPNPFRPADDIPPPEGASVDVLPKPISVNGEPNASEMDGIGPEPQMSLDPFDQRQPKQPDTPLEAMAAPVDVYGPPQQKPEGLMGVGPGQPDLPSNPFDPRLPTSRESIDPSATLQVQGDYAPPETIYNPPEAIPGPGPRRDAAQPLPSPRESIDPNQSLDVTGGDMSEPTRIYPDEPPPVDTPRMPIGLPREPRPLDADQYMALDDGDPLMSAQPEESFMSVEPEVDERSPLEMMLDGGLEKADMASKVDTSTPPESFSPGREARSTEAQRVGEMGDIRGAYDEAEAQVRNLEDRLGPLEGTDREQSILGILKNKLGRDVTKEDLIRAGIISAGVAASMSDDQDTQDVGAGAMVLGGFGRRRPRGMPRTPPPAGESSVMDSLEARTWPRQPSRKLANGETVEGFSALRGEQSDLLDGLDTAKTRVGANGDQTLNKRLMTYNQNPENRAYDKALLSEAEKLGLGMDLKQTALANQYYPIWKRSLLQSPSDTASANLVSRVLGFSAPRADRVGELFSGAPRNPFATDPAGLTDEYFRRILQLTQGKPGAIYGDDARRKIEQLLHPEGDKKDQP